MSRRIVELAETASTNDWIAANPQDGLWVRADRQSAGRGRRGRSWTSDIGNLFASTYVRARPEEGPLQQLSFVAANALHATAARWIAASRLSLKWPNDLLLDGKKLAGILLESSAEGVVVGFGMNLTHHPDGTEFPATSFAAAGISVPGASEVCAMLAEAFDAHRTTWRESGFAATRRDWLAHATGLGAKVLARLGNEDVTGVFDGLGSDGALHLRLQDGTIRPIHAGEVFMLKGQG